MTDIIKNLRAGVPVKDLEDGSNGWEFDADAAQKIMNEAAELINSLLEALKNLVDAVGRKPSVVHEAVKVAEAVIAKAGA